MNGGPVFRGIAAGALLAVAAAWAGMAPAADRGVPFSLDAASFPDSSGGAVTHVYLSVPLTSLRFAAGADGAAFTDLDVAVAIRDRKGHALAEHFWSYRRIPGSLLQQENEGRSLLRRHLFVLPAGESRITARIEAPGGPVLGETTLDHRVPLYADMPLRASDPVFGLCGELVLEAPAANFEGEVLPHPSRLYGDEVPALCVGLFFADTLATAPDSVYWIRYEIRDEAGRGVADSTLTVSRRGSRGEQSRRKAAD